MSEFCRKCFIKAWHPNAYDLEHIVMSEDNEFCEGCMDCVPYVDRIDCSDLRHVQSASDFCHVTTTETKAGRKIACVECGSIFEDDDLAFSNETGLCAYCKKHITAVWIKED